MNQAHYGVFSQEFSGKATNPFGYYQFTDVSVGEAYILSVKSRRHSFQGNAQLLSVTGDMEEISFIANDN